LGKRYHYNILIGDPDELVRLESKSKHHLRKGDDSILADWRDIPSLKLLNIMYDVTPAKYISMVITEIGMIPCTSVPVVLREYGSIADA
jgi:translation initiation factor eIF-2B subunit delta